MTSLKLYTPEINMNGFLCHKTDVQAASSKEYFLTDFSSRDQLFRTSNRLEKT